MGYACEGVEFCGIADVIIGWRTSSPFSYKFL